MASYQTAPLEQYNPRFVQIAQDLFDRVCREIPERQTERRRGSFSIYGQTVKDTAAKIVIYDPQLGRSSDWPRVRDGVYVWVRANGPLGDAIWSDTLPVELPWMFQRMWRDQTVQIAANQRADFAYFPIMAGDDLGHIASLIVGCSRA
jgi:hypothetical protein